MLYLTIRYAVFILRAKISIRGVAVARYYDTIQIMTDEHKNFYAPSPVSMETSDKLFLWIMVLSVVAVIITTAYLFLWRKDYTFVVEAPCDSATELCFYRDCEDYCPPNGLATYRVFEVSAADFSTCSDNSCLRECTSGLLDCSEVFCDVEAGDECSVVGETTTDAELDAEDL